MRLISKKTNLGQEYDNFLSLLDVAGKIQKIFIASAYADVKTIRNIYKYFSSRQYDKRGCQLLIFIDRAASQALDGQQYCRDYRRLNTDIKKSIFGEYSGIKLVGGKLFHSKIIYIKTTVEERIITGSMNMTQKGINKHENEELFLYSEKPSARIIKDTLNYFCYLDDSNISTWVNDAGQASTQITLRDFFMNGNLYVRFTALNLFSFTLNLPENMREATARLHPLLDAEAKNSISMLRFCQEEKFSSLYREHTNLSHSKNRRWTDYCIETLHGYWAPSFFCKHIDDIIFEKKDIKFTEIKNISNILIGSDIENKVFRFFDELSDSINKRNEVWNVDEVKQRWSQWRNRLINRIFPDGLDSDIDESFALRLSLGVQKSNFFDIFNDSDHTSAFIDTVMDFFYFNIDRKGTKNKIINIMKSLNIKLNSPDDFLKIIQSNSKNSFIRQLKALCE